MIQSSSHLKTYSALLQRGSRPLFLPPASTSLIPGQNTARDQLVSRTPSERKHRSDGRRTEQVLLAYYRGYGDQGCWRSRRNKLQQLSRKHGRGFSLRNLARIDKRLRDQGLIETSTGWGSHGRRSTNRHVVLNLDGKGITLRPYGLKSLKKKPLSSYRFSRLADSPRKTVVTSRRGWKPFSRLNPKRFKPQFDCYYPGHFKACKDYMYRIKFWNSCQKYFAPEKRRYFELRYPKPRIKKTWRDICRRVRVERKSMFRYWVQWIQQRNGVCGWRVVAWVRRVGIKKFLDEYYDAFKREWIPDKIGTLGKVHHNLEPDWGARCRAETFLRRYLWFFRHEEETC